MMKTPERLDTLAGTIYRGAKKWNVSMETDNLGCSELYDTNVPGTGPWV